MTLVLAAVASCGRKDQGSEAATERHAKVELTENYVDTIHLAQRDFRHQLVCNGLLRAQVRSELSMPHADVLTELHAHEGQAVSKGQLLAVTDEEAYRRALTKAERDVEKSQIDFLDKLLAMGYDSPDLAPEEALKKAEVTSGLFSAKYDLEKAKQDLADCRLYAPISGHIADVEGKLYQKADKLCSIVDDSAFDVEFNVLESELSSLTPGMGVKVSPFAAEERQYSGSIRHINPSVNEKGLIKATARIPGASGLIDGMNVRVVVERQVPKSLVVPKDAVVERDGYYVVFVYRDGRAVWTYVDIVDSNLSEHAITGCARKNTEVHPSDAIIVSGNMNLADGTPVSPRASEAAL
ncbi:MAG: efflux RND transporter periplasmic adaptor subunit [Bacteroidales bacterium]|nr:efflux RND transporter periplasmic adaptor subunit [Bacteroidales bacterium]